MSAKSSTFRHFPELDGFRGLAILFVVAGHVLDQDFGRATDLGSLGVALFFVLSGFLITGLLEKEWASSGQISLRAFYARRVLRILPASLCYLLIVCALIAWRGIADTPWYSVAACLLFVRNIWGRGAATGHLWSLSLEEQFYAVWPWVMSKTGPRLALKCAVAGTVGVALFRMLCLAEGWLAGGFASAYYFRPWFRFDAILSGCAIALWWSGGSRGLSRAGLGSVSVGVVAWAALISWSVAGQGVSPVWHITVETALCAVVLVNLLASEAAWFRAAFSVPGLRYVGRVSYSWYLWQQVFTQYSAHEWYGLRAFPANVLASVAIAAVSYIAVERPFLRLKDHLSGAWRLTPTLAESGR